MSNLKISKYDLDRNDRLQSGQRDDIDFKTPGKGRDECCNNCMVLGTGEKDSDHKHVTQVTPMATKKKELENDPRYGYPTESDLEKQRESQTTMKRKLGAVRPLGGSATS